MYCFTISNVKGGIGKTTLTSNIGYLLSERKKVLLIDTDTQANLSNYLLPVKSSLKYDFGDVLFEKAKIKEIIKKVRNNLFIAPLLAIGSEFKKFIELELPRNPFIFNDLKSDIEDLGFDYLLIDTPPTSSILIDCIYSIIDEMIIVLNGDSFSVDGLEILQENFKEIKKKRKNNFLHEKIIFNRYNKGFIIHNEYLKTLKKNTHYKIYQVKQYQGFSNALTLKYILTEKEKIESLNNLVEDIIKNGY